MSRATDRGRGQHHHEAEQVERGDDGEEADEGLRAPGPRDRPGRRVPAPRGPQVVVLLGSASRAHPVPLPRGARARLARSRRLARRRSGTSRTRRTPARAARHHRDGRAMRPPARRSSIEAAVAHGRGDRRTPRQRPAPPLRWRRRRGCDRLLVAQLGQVEALVAPSGDQHDGLEPADRGAGGVGRGGLRVVVPAHALQPRPPATPGGGAPGTPGARCGRRRGDPPPWIVAGGGGQRVGEVVREGPVELTGPRPACRRPRARGGRPSRWWSAAGTQPEGDVAGRRLGQVGGHHGVVQRCRWRPGRRAGQPRCAPWRPCRHAREAWLSRWSGARFSQVPTSGA